MKESGPASKKYTDDALWQALGHLRDSAPVAEAYDYARRRATPRPLWRRLRDRLAALLSPRAGLALGGASVLAAVLVAILMPADLEIYATGIGERKAVVLADGSVLMLDTDTRLTVQLGRKERRLELEQGRANFKVAHDAARPFRVTAGGMTVTALGTRFDMAALPGLHAVTLIDGKVAVARADPSGTRPRRHIVLAPGQRLALRANGRLGIPMEVDLDSVLAWHEGRLEFENATVREAIAEANRYSHVKIELAHAPSADRHIDGVFQAGQIDALVAALCTYLDLDVVSRTGDRIVLDRQR